MTLKQVKENLFETDDEISRKNKDDIEDELS